MNKVSIGFFIIALSLFGLVFIKVDPNIKLIVFAIIFIAWLILTISTFKNINLKTKNGKYRIITFLIAVVLSIFISVYSYSNM